MYKVKGPSKQEDSIAVWLIIGGTVLLAIVVWVGAHSLAEAWEGAGTMTHIGETAEDIEGKAGL
jgi:hypothetical protein